MIPSEVVLGGPWVDPCRVLRPFVEAVEQSFCPFIQPASRAGVLFYHGYSTGELAGYGDGDPTAGLFNVAVVHTERLRGERSRMVERGELSKSALICDNIVVTDSELLDWRTAKNLVDWPHYILKSWYTSCGLMFGKFWTQEIDESLDGRPIPPPPMTFLSIRSAIKPRDPFLLGDQVEFANQITISADNGEDVLASHLGPSDEGLSTTLLRERRVFARAKERLQIELETGKKE